MREILFRGKRADNGEWVEGGILCTENWDSIFVCKDYQGNFNEAPYSDVEEIDVIPETVGQYTGLTDKYGTKIFEGDLLKGNIYPFFDKVDGVSNYFAEVIWSEERAGFELVTHKFPESEVSGISEGICVSMGDFDDSEWEVIGNIYDNSELLNITGGIK